MTRGEGVGKGGRRQGDFGADVCVCPKCGYKEPHVKGVPCYSKVCPRCEARLEGQ